MRTSVLNRRIVRTAAVATAIGLLAAGCSQTDIGSSSASARPVSAGVDVHSTIEAADGAGHDDAHRDRLSPVGQQGRSWSSMIEYLDFALADVHAYWVGVERGFGRPDPTVNYLWPEPGVSYQTSCGATDDRTMRYCIQEDTIHFSQAAAQHLWNGTFEGQAGRKADGVVGDFAVAYLVAHEYAHNMQAEYGLLNGYSTWTPAMVLKTERHADCWAGAWASSTYAAGTLEPGDLEEALLAAWVISDTRHDHERTHGTPEQRRQDFMTGYHGVDPRTCTTLLS